MILTYLAVGVGLVGWFVVARKVLLAWYLLEVRSFDVPQASEEAIVTYPLI
jgi:hypothetical protein